MELKLTANILEENKNCFVAWINEIKGVVAQGESIEEVKQELLKVLSIKLEIERKASKSINDENLITEEFNLTQC